MDDLELSSKNKEEITANAFGKELKDEELNDEDDLGKGPEEDEENDAGDWDENDVEDEDESDNTRKKDFEDHDENGQKSEDYEAQGRNNLNDDYSEEGDENELRNKTELVNKLNNILADTEGIVNMFLFITLIK